MDVQGMMPTRMHPTKKKPCCPKAKKSQPWMDGTLNTEYRNEFIDKEVPVQRAGPKQGPPMANGPFDGSTTYGGDFKPYQVARSGPIIPPNSQTLNGGDFNGDSTYKQNFGPKAVPYERIRARTAFEPNRGEFYGQTTYGGDFKTMGVPQPAKMIQRVNNVEKSGPFEGESLYKSTFTKMANAQRAPANPRGGGQVLPPGAFEGDTIYRSNYVPKEIGVPEQFRPKDARQAPEGWFEGMPSTEYRGQFIDKEVPTVQPVRPNRGGDVLPKGPLDGSTTYGGAFKHCQGPPATLSRPVDAQEREKLPFNGTSSYQSAFIPKAVPYSRVRAARNFEPNKAPFDGSTTHKAAYQGYAVVPTHRAGPQHAAREHVPFEGQSAYKADFVKMNGAQRAPKVPQNARVRSGPFEGTTTYRKDFTEKEIPAGEDSCTDCDSDDMEDYPLIG